MYLLFSIELFITKKMMNQLLFMFVSQMLSLLSLHFIAAFLVVQDYRHILV